MIPTVILLGLIAGRWWRATLLVAAIAWPAWLVAGDAMELEVALLGAAAAAVLNAAAGVAVHQALLRLARWLRGQMER